MKKAGAAGLKKAGAKKPACKAKPAAALALQAKAAGKRGAAAKAAAGATPLTPEPPPPLPRDPWLAFKSRHGGKLSTNDEWLKLSSGDVGWRLTVAGTVCRELCGSPGAMDGAALDALMDAPPAAPAPEPASDDEPEPEPEPAGEDPGCEGVCCVGADLVAFALSERQRSAVTSLDLTDNRLSGAGAVALGAARNGCWLRELVLTAHPTRPERARWG